ncbi:MAG: phosphotransferase, partial [Pseudomonadota bacterium]
AEIGRGLAVLHDTAAGFELQRRNALGPDAWRPLFEQSRHLADTVRKGLTDAVDAELDHIEAHWPHDLPQGIIHADLFPDNAFFVGRALSGIIDFYFACNDLIAYDLAVCVNAWCFEDDGAFNVTKARALTRAYDAARPLSEAERAALPLLCRGAALRFLLTRLHDWLRVPEGALVTPKDPRPYLERLRFHRTLSGPSAYGLGDH